VILTCILVMRHKGLFTSRSTPLLAINKTLFCGICVSVPNIVSTDQPNGSHRVKFLFIYLKTEIAVIVRNVVHQRDQDYNFIRSTDIWYDKIRYITRRNFRMGQGPRSYSRVQQAYLPGKRKKQGFNAHWLIPQQTSFLKVLRNLYVYVKSVHLLCVRQEHIMSLHEVEIQIYPIPFLLRTIGSS